MLTPVSIARSGTIASGQAGWPHHASGAIRSGHLSTTGTPDGSKFLRDDFAWEAATATIGSGAIGSGKVASGAVQGFFGTTPHIASGTVGVFDFGSGAVVAGAVGSGAVVSGNIASGQLGRFHIASGQLAGFELGSGSIVSGRIASGQVGNFHISSGAVTSGRLGVTGTPDGTLFLRDDFSWAGATVTLGSGDVGSGIIASGAVPGFFGPYRGIMSGTVGVDDFGSGAVVAGAVGSGAIVSGNIASGQIGSLHIASGRLTGFELGSGAIVSGRIASGQIGQFHLSSGSVTSGAIGTGQVDTFHFASGAKVDYAMRVSPFALGKLWQIFSEETISGTVAVQISQSGTLRVAMASVSGRMPAIGVARFNYASGASVNVLTDSVFNLSSGMADYSGYLGQPLFVGRSGQVVTASGSWNSGGLASGDFYQQVGVVWNSGGVMIRITDALREGTVLSGNLGSGQVGQFHISSGAVTSGRLGVTGTPDGTLFLRDDFSWQAAGGAVGSGAIGSGKVASGTIQGYFGVTRHIASGTVGVYDFGSGLTAQFTGPFISGTSWTAITQENISGVRAVQLSQSGTLRIAMAGVSGRMPAVGIVWDNVASGIQANVYNLGVLQATSGLVDYSGYLGGWLFVGRSGQIVTNSGSWNSGGFLSGDLNQTVGVVRNSGSAAFGMAILPPLVAGQVISGDVASGALGTYHHSSGSTVTRATAVFPIVSGLFPVLTAERISGVKAVAISQSGVLQIAMASVSGRMPAVGVVFTNVESGIPANVFTQGLRQFDSGLADYSGYLGKRLWVGRSGQIVTTSGSFNSGGHLSGDYGQSLGIAWNSGGMLVELNTSVWSGGPIATHVMGGPF